MNPNLIYGGFVQKVIAGSLNTDALGNSNAEILFDPKGYEVNSGQEKQMYGVGTVKIQLAETDQAAIDIVKALANTNTTLTVYDYWVDSTHYKGWHILAPGLWNYKVTRGFGDDAHTIELFCKRKYGSASSFVVRVEASGSSGAG